MKTKATHPNDERPSEPCPSFEIETQEDYALAVERLKALESGPKFESDTAEANALKTAIKTWDGRKAEL